MIAHLTKQFIKLHVSPRAKPYEIYDTLVKGLLLRVQPTGTQVYYVTYVNATGKRKRIKIAHASQISPQQARDRAKQLLASVICGEDPAFQKKMSKRSYRLDAFIESIYQPWLESSRKRGREEALRLKSSFKLLLSLELSQVNVWHIERWRKQRKQQGTSLSTMNRDFASLNALLNRAVEWEFLAENPLLGKVKRYKIDNQRIRFLSVEERQRLKESLGKYKGDVIHDMVILSLNTGLRRGELFNLTWEDVDFELRYMTVKPANSKNGRRRNIPLNTTAYDILRHLKLNSPGDGLVFPNKTGNPYTTLKKSWAALMNIAEIDNFRWHDMRHDFASSLVMAGVELNTVRELLGHADIKMTLRYAHLAPEHKAAAVEKISFQ